MSARDIAERHVNEMYEAGRLDITLDGEHEMDTRYGRNADVFNGHVVDVATDRLLPIKVVVDGDDLYYLFPSS